MADRRQTLAMLAAGFVAGVRPAAAQTKWPEKPIKLVVPFTPGGSTDVLARIIGQKMTEQLGQQVIIENKAGAGGTIACTQVARADADGHTLMMGHIGTLAFNPSLYPNPGYDPVKDFVPVALVATLPNILTIHPSLPAATPAEFIAYCRANPGKVHYGSGGNGSAAHIATGYFGHAAGIDIVHVPHRGTAPAVTDLLAGTLQMMLTGGPALLPHVAAGKLKALAVSSRTRAPFAPDLPTLAETVLPKFEAVQWYGVVAPAGTPAAIVKRLNALINGQLDQPDVSRTLSNDGALATPMTPAEFGGLITSEIALWRDVIKRANITVG